MRKVILMEQWVHKDFTLHPKTPYNPYHHTVVMSTSVLYYFWNFSGKNGVSDPGSRTAPDPGYGGTGGISDIDIKTSLIEMLYVLSPSSLLP